MSDIIIDGRQMPAAIAELEIHLSGAVITGSCFDVDSDSFGFTIERFNKKKIVWIQKDPENNGPGTLVLMEW